MGITDNVFLVSDASYSYQTKIAGLAVIDLYTGRTYSTTQHLTSGSHKAEFNALLYSIHIAIDNKYTNVVFIYDNKNLDISKLKVFASTKINTCQFLWLKRAYIHKVDLIANKARKLRETLLLTADSKVRIRDKNYQLKGKELLYAFKCNKTERILNACLVVAKDEEKIILQQYIYKIKGVPIKQEFHIDKLNTDFFNLIYYLVPKNEKGDIYTFIVCHVSNIIDKSKIVQPKIESFYIKYVELVLKTIKTRNQQQINETSY